METLTATLAAAPGAVADGAASVPVPEAFTSEPEPDSVASSPESSPESVPVPVPVPDPAVNSISTLFHKYWVSESDSLPDGAAVAPEPEVSSAVVGVATIELQPRMHSL